MQNKNIQGWFWISAILLLVWNVIGLIALLFDPAMGLGDSSKLPAEQAALYADRPQWAFWGFIVAVASGTLACIALLMRSAIAAPLFIISFIGLVIQNSWLLIDSHQRAALKITDSVMPIVVCVSIIIGLSLCKKAKQKGWMH